MEIFVHIGPHKTGTTAIQSLLLNTCSNRFYYPPPSSYGPGHATIAWNTHGINGHKASVNALQLAIQQGENLGYDRIVFSSEEFSRGINVGSFSALNCLRELGKFTLVITLSDLSNRFRAEIFEQIKHHVHYPDLGKINLYELMAKRPGLSPDFLPMVFEACEAHRIVVCLTDKRDENALYRCFQHLLGLEDLGDEALSHNRSNSFLHIYLLNQLNKLYVGGDASMKRDVAERTRILIERALENGNSFEFPGFSAEQQTFIDGLWKLQLAFIEQLHKAGSIELFQSQLYPVIRLEQKSTVD